MDWNDEPTVLKALALLYSNQTKDERIARVTAYDNGVGFNATDAEFLSSVAEQLFVRGKGISEKQYELIKVMLRKYEHTQLTDLDNAGISLPDTAVVYRNGNVKKEDVDGIIKVAQGKLLFKPFVYPSTQIKTLGFVWAKVEAGCWNGSLNISNFEKLKVMFPRHSLDRSAEEWLEELESPVELSEDVLASDLFGFQKEAVAFLIKARKAMLALAPGLGKTPTSVMAINELGGNTLVICPLPLLYNWKREIRKWSDEEFPEIWHGYLGRGESTWTITNYETALRCMVDFDEKVVYKNGKNKKIRTNWRPVEQFMFDNIIIDESVLIKNRDAQRTHAVHTLVNKLQTVKNVFLLSGSPTTKFYDDLWSQFHTIDPKRFSSYWKFTREYCVIEDTFWGTRVHSNQEGAAARIKRDCRDIYFAKTQDQVLKLPDWIFDYIEVPMDTTQAKLYRDMQDNFVATLPEGDRIVATNILAQMTRLIQFASNPMLVGGPDVHPKWNAAIDMLEYEQLPAIIWTNFIKTGEMLEEELKKRKYKVGMLVGDTSNAQRDAVVTNFQYGNLDVVVAHPAVGKFGLTLTAARTAIYLERSYNGDDYYQSLHRVRRIGTTASPHVIILASLDVRKENGEHEEYNTIDHVIHEVLGFKRENSVQITTGIIREVLSAKV